MRFKICWLFLVLVVVLTTPSFCAEILAPWPQANGPYGNFTPIQSKEPLLDDCSKAKQLWISEDQDMGYAKGSASGYLSNLARWNGHPGSSSGPIFAEGKIFVTTFRPSGEAWAEHLPQFKNYDPSTAKKPYSKEEEVRLKENLRILADDLLIAIDAKTGKTAWKATEVGKGLNRYMGKRQGFCVSPAYSDGIVISMGTTGLLYAYQATDGKKLWETNIGEAHQKALEHKQSVLEKKTLPGGMGWDVSLTVAKDVLIVPLFDGTDVTLRCVNIKSGETIWEAEKACSRHATPAIWKHQNKDYVLTATVSGKLHLIDPTNGKFLWTIEGLGENHFSLTPTKEYVFVNGGSNIPRKEGSDVTYGLLAGYRISPSEAKLAWKHPEQAELCLPTWMDSCARRFLAVQDGKVFYRAHGIDKSVKQLMILEESTGKVIAKHELNSPGLQYYPLQDRLLTIRDASHSETELAFIQTANSKIRPLSEFWHPPHENTTAYEVYMEHPIVNGCIYLRTKDGRIACYDLTKTK